MNLISKRGKPPMPSISQVAERDSERSSPAPPPSEIPPLPKPAPLPQAPQEPQIIEDRYIDEDKLLAICQARFGLGNYRLKYKNNRYYLRAPEIIDEDILEQCDSGALYQQK